MIQLNVTFLHTDKVPLIKQPYSILLIKYGNVILFEFILTATILSYSPALEKYHVIFVEQVAFVSFCFIFSVRIYHCREVNSGLVSHLPCCIIIATEVISSIHLTSVV